MNATQLPTARRLARPVQGMLLELAYLLHTTRVVKRLPRSEQPK
ncbi:MAG: hypothetical protein ACRC33_08270 [Gemmataceae bacterium]